MTRQVINPGTPPLIWSNINQAFSQINQNFVNLYATIEGGGGTPVDFGDLNTNVSPATTNSYDIGSSTKKWRDLFINGTLTIGSASITSTGSAVNLPSGSTIGGTLLDQEYFRQIEVSGQPTVVANAGGASVLTLATGNGISITTDATLDSITITNTGIISAAAGAGINLAGTNPLTVTNTGIISASAGTGISVSGTNPLEITNTGVTRLEAGAGIILDTSTGTVTVSNGSPASTLRCFEYIQVPGQAVVRADNNNDTLTIEGDEHLVVTTDGTTDSLHFSFNNHVDIVGSVFAEDSSVLVDATDSRHYGYFVGDMTGSVFADDSTKLVDAVAGKIVGEVDTFFVTTSDGISIGLSNYGIVEDEVGDLYVIGTSTAGDIYIRTNSSGLGQNDFVFGKDGNLIVPEGSTIKPRETTSAPPDDFTIQGQTATNTNTEGGDLYLDGGVGDVGNGYANGALWLGQNSRLIRIGGSGGQITEFEGEARFLPGASLNFQGVSVTGLTSLTTDIIGSIYADDSMLLVDAVDGLIRGNVDTEAIATTDIYNQGATGVRIFNELNANLVIDASSVTVQNVPFTLTSYADASARDLAITSPVGGMLCYITGTNKFQGYVAGTGWTDLN